MNTEKTTIPSSSAAPYKRFVRTITFDLFRSSLVTLVGLVALVIVAEPAIKSWRAEESANERARLEAETEIAHRERDLLMQQLEAIKDLPNRIMVPPSNDKLFSILSMGVGVTEDVYLTTNVGTTPTAAFTTDLTTAQRTDAYTQEVLIQNTHATQNLCVKPIAWSGVTTCAALCAASGYTCSGAATDGWRLSSGQAIPRRWDGTNCVCVVGSAASTTFQSERVIR